MIQKATAMDNWWLAASSQQCTHSCIMSHAELFGKISKCPGDSAPLQPRFDTLQFLAFPRTKITFEREEILIIHESGKYDRAADGGWENCLRSLGAYCEGGWGIIFWCTMVLVSSSVNVSFSYYIAGCLLDRPHILIQVSCSLFT